MTHRDLQLALGVWLIGIAASLWIGTLMVLAWWLVEVSGLGLGRFVALVGMLGGSLVTGFEAWRIRR